MLYIELLRTEHGAAEALKRKIITKEIQTHAYDNEDCC